MHWDSLFSDLEDQLSAEWESERAALDTEAERLRIARVTLRMRLCALAAARAAVTVHVAGAAPVAVQLRDVGADWFSADPGRHGMMLIPLGAPLSLQLEQPALLASVEAAAPDDGLRGRMTLGFVLRDLARRRVPVTISDTSGGRLTGTIDRAGADHLDLAVHDLDEPRRREAVRGYRMVPFSALAIVTLERGGARPGGVL